MGALGTGDKNMGINMEENKKLSMKWMSLIIPILFFLLIMPGITSQETNDVCFVHFTEQDCPNCLTIDVFIQNLTQIYNNTMIITYDLSVPGNEQVFNLYAQKYGIYRYMPAVLFGKYDFFISMDDIRAGLEKRIIYFTGQDGNECPMVDGTTSPPSDVGEGSDLPGEPAVIAGDQVGQIPQDDGEGDIITPEEDDQGENEGNQIIGMDDITNIIENITNPQDTEDYLIIAAIIIVVIVVIALVIAKKGRKRRKGKK